MINTSVDLIALDVSHWLQHNWPDYEQWVQGKKIPEAAVVQSFVATFAQPPRWDQLHHYLRALGRTPLLQLNRAIAMACCAAYATALELSPNQTTQSVVMLTAIDVGLRGIFIC